MADKRDDEQCIFCAIAAGHAEASVVHEDEHAVAFMDLNPITPGHMLWFRDDMSWGWRTSTRRPEPTCGARVTVWPAPATSGLRCEGTNVFLADGEVAFQEVFHFHLHVFPRYAMDGFTIDADWSERPRSLLNEEAKAVREAMADPASGNR